MSERHLSVINVIAFCFCVFCSSISAQQDSVDSVRVQAERGDAIAQYNLGVMYAEGRGVPMDDTEAVRWYRLAAEQGDVVAQVNLAVMYVDGRGVSPDSVLAHMWLDLAMSQLTGESMQQAREARDLVGLQLTVAQLEKAQRLAREWESGQFSDR